MNRSDACDICPYKELCEANGIYLEECQDKDFEQLEDPDFANLIYKKYKGEDYWNEMSYYRFVENELDYGDLNDIDDNDSN